MASVPTAPIATDALRDGQGSAKAIRQRGSIWPSATCCFCRKHETLTKAAGGIHTTPAMAAGVAGHVWKLDEVVALLDR